MDYDRDNNSRLSFNSCLSSGRRTTTLLFEPALRTLSVPVSSAPVECIFSYGGLVLTSYHCRMTDKTLTPLVFSECAVFVFSRTVCTVKVWCTCQSLAGKVMLTTCL